MRVVFMGTPAFALPALSALTEKHQVLAVYTRCDAASGRGKTLLPTPVKERALELGIPVRTPASLDEEEIAYLRSLDCDLFVVVAYGLLLPREALDIPSHGALNIHASLLPRWRGAAPMQRAILAGDEVAGVSIMKMEEGLDTGPYCAQASTDVGDKDLSALEEELSCKGAELLLQTMDLLERGDVAWADQEDSCSCYAAKIDKRELRLDPASTVLENLRKVRASSDQAPAKAQVCGKGVTFIKACASSGPAEGAVEYRDKHLLLGCADGALDLLFLKPDGGKAMEAVAFAAGMNKVLGTNAACWKAL